MDMTFTVWFDGHCPLYGHNGYGHLAVPTTVVEPFRRKAAHVTLHADNTYTAVIAGATHTGHHLREGIVQWKRGNVVEAVQDAATDIAGRQINVTTIRSR
jgi:hypothetical protein